MFKNYLQLVAHCDKYPYDPAAVERVFGGRPVPILLFGNVIGNVLPDIFVLLKAYNDQCSPAPFNISTSSIEFQPWVDSFEKRTEVVKTLMDTWRPRKAFMGWRNELYPVYGDPSHPDNIAFVMERAATPLFGISTFGVHVNGYVQDERGEIKVWVARRAMAKQTWPGMLDNCVAGGISYAYSTKETVVKECDEEASIPPSIAQSAINTGVISYYTYTENGLQPETQYIFDLKLPTDFKPMPRDGEVECFYLWDMAQLKKSMMDGLWKPNCAIVTIDFMIRHGIITADNEADFIDINTRLHRRLEFPNPCKTYV
ncbi:NUDIX hydrolase domain-like protein [Dichotomocladium elegans]|nr:NUDIX hydrolase domain-like protein [Dichotomocladium elegans]